ncbi:MAG TPA: bacteriohemerythrin [Desulfuromonadaceae bacterium]
MAFIEWDDRYSVGVTRFNEQHRRIVGMINRLDEAMQGGTERQTLQQVLSDLAGYTKTHFAEEERLMEEHGYPGLATHREEHRKLNRELASLYTSFFTSKKPLTADMMAFLGNWLYDHIQGTDKQYEPFFSERGID